MTDDQNLTKVLPDLSERVRPHFHDLAGRRDDLSRQEIEVLEKVMISMSVPVDHDSSVATAHAGPRISGTEPLEDRPRSRSGGHGIVDSQALCHYARRCALRQGARTDTGR